MAKFEKEDEFELDDEGKSYIKVSDDMRLLLSARSWQLQKKLIAGDKSKSKGEVRWVSFKYFTTLQGALNSIIHISTSKEFFNDAASMIRANEIVIERISKAFSPKYEIKEN